MKIVAPWEAAVGAEWVWLTAVETVAWELGRSQSGSRVRKSLVARVWRWDVVGPAVVTVALGSSVSPVQNKNKSNIYKNKHL